MQTVKATRRQRLAQPKPAPRLAVFETELGWMALVGEGATLHALTFGHSSPRAAVSALGDQAEGADTKPWKTPLERRLTKFARGEEDDFSNVEVAPFWTSEFQAQVLAHCRRIPYGGQRSYAQLAALAGSPGAARAVGSVMRKNRVPLVIPCHRVVGSGNLGGYSGAAGLSTKRRLLELEGHTR
jgi:methylated-DNA-[protein]-cysteine S-methyltransferase